jgi:hypothetical protein
VSEDYQSGIFKDGSVLPEKEFSESLAGVGHCRDRTALLDHRCGVDSASTVKRNTRIYHTGGWIWC